MSHEKKNVFEGILFLQKKRQTHIDTTLWKNCFKAAIKHTQVFLEVNKCCTKV